MKERTPRQWIFTGLYTFLRQKQELDENYKSKITQAINFLQNDSRRLESYADKSNEELREVMRALGWKSTNLRTEEIREYDQQLNDYMEQLRELRDNPERFYRTKTQYACLSEICQRLGGLYSGGGKAPYCEDIKFSG